MSDNKKAADAAASASLQEEMDAVMRKYDRESNTRAWEGKPKIAVQAYLAAFAIFNLLHLVDAVQHGRARDPPDRVPRADRHHGLPDLPRQQEACARQPPAVVRYRHHGHRRGCVFLLLL